MHNYLRLTYNAQYVPAGFVDQEDGRRDVIPGDWRKLTVDDSGAMQSMRVGRAHIKYSFDANEVRNKFKAYFLMSRGGSIPWQVTDVEEQLPVPEKEAEA